MSKNFIELQPGVVLALYQGVTVAGPDHLISLGIDNYQLIGPGGVAVGEIRVHLLRALWGDLVKSEIEAYQNAA